MENNEKYLGCRRACRQQGAHTQKQGECVEGPPPVATVSITRQAVSPDGYLITVLDSYTDQELTDLIAPRLRYLIDAHGTKISPEALAGHVASVIINRSKA